MGAIEASMVHHRSEADKFDRAAIYRRPVQPFRDGVTVVAAEPGRYGRMGPPRPQRLPDGPKFLEAKP